MTENSDDRPSHDAYVVGYGRPPRCRQFQPGCSGNLRGRPKGSKNFNALLSEELAQLITLSENGRHRRIPKRQALVKQLVNKALGNDPKAAALLINLLQSIEGSKAATGTMDASLPKDKRLMENIIRRIKSNSEAPSSIANEAVSKDLT